MSITEAICLAALLTCAPLLAQTGRGGDVPVLPGREITWGIGGCGGAYLYAQPGELIVEVEKRDRNRSGAPSDLRAILVGPDRAVLQDVTIPFAGQAKGSGDGPAQRVRLTAQVARPGVYGLNITVSNDRYGDNIIWGLWTNCPRSLIETSRGHRDRAHEEPIVLLREDQPCDVCFLPCAGEFGLDIAGLPAAVTQVTVSDATGTVVADLPVTKGEVTHTFPASAQREHTPWRLHLTQGRAVVQIDGVTRWKPDDLYRDLACWSPDPKSWFPLLENRWLVTPYRRTVYARPGATGQVTLQVHNSLVKERAVRLSLEFPGPRWDARLDTERVVVAPRGDAPVTVRLPAPAEGQERVCDVRVTPEDDPSFSTYSTLTVRGGEAPARRPLAMPLVLRPYEHENEQFGYVPDYPTDSQPYFDHANRPYIRTYNGIATKRDGKWVTTDFAQAVTKRVPDFPAGAFTMPSTKIGFDRDDDVYLVARSGAQAALLHSRDQGRTFTAYLIPGFEDRSRHFDIEVFTGHNECDGPPPVLRYTAIPQEPDPKLFWRRVSALEMFLPRKTATGIELGDPIPISQSTLGSSQHSGIPTCLASRGTKVHLIWGEATDPAQKVPGVPAYVATYDRTTGKLGQPVLIGYGPPANDVHNSPSLTLDSQGYLHALGGTHGQPFPYAKSLQPNDASGGFTEAVTTSEHGGQTYIGLLCGPDDTLHLVARLSRTGEPFPSATCLSLAIQQKLPGQPWEPPTPLIIPPFSEYSVYYHRLTCDRKGALYLSYDYWSTYWFYRNDHRGGRRVVMMSPDGGKTWRLW